jgi:raffinose/stachyose/melibiose transport system permease protein
MTIGPGAITTTVRQTRAARRVSARSRNPFASSTRGRALPWFGIAPGLLLFGLFSIVPSVTVVFYSFTDLSGIPGIPWNWIGLDNYTRFFASGEASANLAVIGRTLIFAVSVTVVLNALALTLAVLLNNKIRGAAIFRAIIFMPVVLGVTVTGLIWSLFFNPTGGPAAALWSLFGQSSAFLGDPHLAFGIVIFVQIWMSLGYSMMIYHAGLMAIPSELYEAATIDGASAVQRFRHVTIPLIASSTTINVLISIIGSLQTYQIIYVLTGSRPSTSVLAMQIFSLGFGGSSEQGYASAISMIQFVLTGAISLIALWYLRRKETQL